MKTTYFKIAYIKLLTLSALILCSTSCEFEEQIDPNNSSLEGVLTNASINQLNNLVTGIEASMRSGIATQTTTSGTMAREMYLFNADPRNTSDLLGENGGSLDNNSFYSTATWSGRYSTIKNANILLEAINNTESISEQQLFGYSGFAKTIQAYEYLEILKIYNRARIDVSNPDELGPILEFKEALDEIIILINEALNDLNQAGNSFEFSLAGFTNLDTPQTFSQFNRAVAAIAYLYDEDGASSLTALSDSYLDLNGDLTFGAQHIFGLGTGDSSNGLFKITDNNGDQIVVHNSWINDAEAGDTRITTKTSIRANPTSQANLNGTNQTALYESNVSPIDIIRNEELVLVYAEANILINNLQNAETAINVIRNSASLLDFDGDATSSSELTTELLNQRRYSLWGENHRMFDLRRYGLSNTLPIDRSGDQIFNVLPIPLTENE